MKRIMILIIILFLGFIISLSLLNSIPNLFFIEAAVFAAAYILQMIFRILTVYKIKKKAENVYECHLKYNNVLKLLFSVFPKHISLHSQEKPLNLVIIFVRKKHAKYHFATKSCVEVYVGNRETYRTGKVRYSIGKNVTWKLVSNLKISRNENAKTVFILTKAPMDVTSSDKSANEYLANGDVFLEDCEVHTKKHFIDKTRKLREYTKNTSKTVLEHFDLYNLKLDDAFVNLYVSHRKATKATHVHCTDGGDIIWEQFYLFGGMSRPAREKKYLLKPICDKTAITAVVIRGKPSNIIGLDNGLFKSHSFLAENGNVYLMSEQNLPLFLKQFSK